jgi:LmbE family N-acetylglucosaminyl deacetylase
MTTSGAIGERTDGDTAVGAESVLLVYAHPDDEIFGAAGMTAALRERGIAVTLLCATKGEVGQISDPALATAETLGQVREAELRAAMAELGVDERSVRFLDYRDSGMDGTPENDDPRALIRQPEEVVAGQIAEVIRELRPQTVVTFGPDGVYGHPDHLYVHRVTVRAVHLAAEAESREVEQSSSREARTPLLDSSTSRLLDPTPWRVAALYFSTTPRERIQERAAKRQGPFKEMKPERLALLGTPRAEITTALDVGAYYERKLAAVRAHRTQFGPGGPMAELSREEVARLFSREHFARMPLPWADPQAEAADPLAVLAADLGTTPL